MSGGVGVAVEEVQGYKGRGDVIGSVAGEQEWVGGGGAERLVVGVVSVAF